MPLPNIDPPLLNSACPWATTKEDLQALFDCESTGAVTIRTSLLDGFDHNPSIHQYAFFDASDHTPQPANSAHATPTSNSGSLNTLGYSPILFSEYLSILIKVVQESSLPQQVQDSKPFIVSVTGSARAVAECYRKIQGTQAHLSIPLCMEINLSCPNIPDKPPPAYSSSALAEYLHALAGIDTTAGQRRVAIGIKTPPYTYHDQYQSLIDALLAGSSSKGPVDFITATNTLGSCLILQDSDGKPALDSASGEGIGGMAGAPLHPLSLGNVRTIRSMLDQHEKLRDIDIIGVGGVCDKTSFDRMRSVGASVMGVGTALGREGVQVFGKITRGL
ncbi:hypothetical protein M409DRAFT_63034 [Zasmidium cellare ATCC 36951]|uniref:Dihydroorotate dehydrogenase (fumarate) n=1 Tax=Zasmidium cellare ATCC 36951 TaxID=1080233 RepID=A0A6A6D1J0_ZASCE|nr:uncharacterized protein M409DRAFT_63034 [Zasmidium cellare ATCC 36951]KAF2172310.1 hypothetical protein M409DRAFT_63034 [Zasmidium cellare ATCC 36951]